MSIAFYISGHGFGHAIRQIEIINTLAALDPSIRLIVRTSAPRWLFERTASSGTLLEGEVDTGVVQRDSLTLDEANTIRRAGAFYASLQGRVEAEASLLSRHGVTLVVADAPALGCAAAAHAGVLAVVCANFTWDWIYAAYAEWLALAPHLLPALRDAYARAAAGWRMPMHGGFATVPSIVDVPFVARPTRADRSREETRRELGLPASKALVLVSFGGYGIEGLPLDRLDCTPHWGVVVTGLGSRLSTHGSSQSAGRARSPVIALDEADIYAAGLRYQDVVRAVDVVLTKPGYGIISDCVATGTAMLYTSRGRFAEYDVLVAEMPRYLRCQFIDGDALKEGRWRDALDALLALPPPVQRPRTDGADVVAKMILEQM